MDLLNWPAGLALLTVVAVAAGVAAWNRSRREAESRRHVDAPDQSPPLAQPPPSAERIPAHQAAAKTVIEHAQARAAAQVALVESAPLVANAASAAALVPQPEQAPEPERQPLPQFDSPAWAATEPMPGMGVHPQFADTMPAEMSFGDTNFADTLVTELVAEERPRPVPGRRRRPA